MAGGKGKMKKKKGNGKFAGDQLGRALAKDRRRTALEKRAHMKSDKGAQETIAAMGFGSVAASKKSVTETNELEAFLAEAMLANKSFASERNSRVINLFDDDSDADADAAAGTGEHGQGESHLGPKEEDLDQGEESVNKRKVRFGGPEIILLDKTENEDGPITFDYRNLPIPRRPAWTRDMSAQELDANERAAFLKWRRGIAELEEKNPDLFVSPFEKNLDFWRQLWRVVERSDLVVQVVDARNPLLFRCTDVESITSESGAHKMNLLLVNKADYLSKDERRRWREWFESNGVHFLFFSAKTEIARNEELVRRQRRGLDLDQLSQEDRDAAHNGVQESDDLSTETVHDIIHSTELIVTRARLSKTLERLAAATKRKQDALAGAEVASKHKATVGMVGYPNVGKSSVINALFGVTSADHTTARVSVSATPGHTKHFQTLHLSEETILCDCPGLVFPTFMSTKADLICNGILPIDEIRGRDFFPAIELVARCIPRAKFEQVYGLRLALAEAISRIPGEMLIETFCEKRGLHAQGHGRLNEAMGARIILKDFVSGKLCYCVPPPLAESVQESGVKPPSAPSPSTPQLFSETELTTSMAEAEAEAEVEADAQDEDVEMTEEDLALLLEHEQLLYTEGIKIGEKVDKEHQKVNKKKQTKHQRRKFRPKDPYGTGDYFEAKTTGHANSKGKNGGSAAAAFTRPVLPYMKN